MGGGMRWTRLALGLWIALGCVRATAQAPSVLEPPRVIELPSMTVPAGVDAPADGRIEATIQVDREGRAVVEECAAAEVLCAVVREAVERARFEPGRRSGVAIDSRIRIALTLAAPADVATATPQQSPSADSRSTAPDDGADDGNGEVVEADVTSAFSATGRTVKAQPGMRRLELAEMRDLPGAFGDPFRAVDSLPGVVPVISGLPYVFVRGAPPAGTLYIYDGIPMPTLFHLAVGPAVIHPRMVGPVRLYSGVAPARYGRLTGGVVVGEGPERPDGSSHAEAELRLLDVSGYLQTPALGGDLTMAARYGYPAMLLSVFSPDINLAYWDYQLRYTAALSLRDRLELVLLGSYDAFGDVKNPRNDVTITFHRAESRLTRRIGRTELGAALLLGWEQSALSSEFKLSATRVGPRMWVESRFGEHTRLRISSDLVGVSGQFSGVSATASDGRGRQNLFGDVPARSMWGLQAELDFQPFPAVELQLGARADAWVQGAGAEGVLDPRARVIWYPSPVVDLHIASGVVHQPAVFYIPLPGIVDVATDKGLQAAIQTEVGAGWDSPLGLRAEVQAFMHLYQNLVFVDALALNESFDMICSGPLAIDCAGAQLADRIDGMSYGAELFLKRPVDEDVSGWVSYTLAWSTVDDVAGVPYTPTWDVRHVGNAVVQWKIGGGFSAGARVQARSGKVNGEFLIDDSQMLARDTHRLPWFVRLDAQIAYAWQPSWGRMRVSLEWFNTTFAQEPIDTVCTGMPRTCRTIYIPAIVFPNLGVRGEI